MLATILSSIVCLAVGIACGYAACARKRHLGERGESLDDGSNETRTAFETRVTMVEGACQETKGKRDEEKQAFARACKISEQGVRQLNRLIERRAQRGDSSAHVVIRTREDVLREERYKSAVPKLPRNDDIIYASSDTLGYVGKLLRDFYGRYGYSTDARADSDWLGHAFVSLYIDWSDGIDTEQLRHIEFSSQVEAFKAGVPLEDILA